jgi:pimeloyl-ACP methyl ester carboxylesterase
VRVEYSIPCWFIWGEGQATLACWPFVIVEVTFAVIEGDPEHWSSKRNEAFLTSDETGELRSYCQEHLKAGPGPDAISIQGFSFGARGVLHHALRFPDRFASAVSSAFVSDYALEEEQAIALENRDAIQGVGHDVYEISFHKRPEGGLNGLEELKFHAAAWRRTRG